MVVIEQLSEGQRNLLVDIRRDYMKYLSKHGEIKAIRDRVNGIDNEFKAREKPIREHEYG